MEGTQHTIVPSPVIYIDLCIAAPLNPNLISIGKLVVAESLATVMGFLFHLVLS